MRAIRVSGCRDGRLDTENAELVGDPLGLRSESQQRCVGARAGSLVNGGGGSFIATVTEREGQTQRRPFARPGRRLRTID